MLALCKSADGDPSSNEEATVMFKEFKKFALRGNVMDMAIGIILGAAFGKIVASFVKGVVMPPIGLLVGGVNFDDLKYVLQDGIAAVKEGEKVVTAAVPEVAIQYGAFLTRSSTS